jgi:hypothetical protein
VCARLLLWVCAALTGTARWDRGALIGTAGATVRWVGDGLIDARLLGVVWNWGCGREP